MSDDNKKTPTNPKPVRDINHIPLEAKEAAIGAAEACYKRSALQYGIDRTLMRGQIKPIKGPDEDGFKNTCAHDMIATALYKAGITIDRNKQFEVYNAIACEGYVKVHPREKESMQSDKICPIR
ncbi:MAG: hypothetical protein ACK52W_05220 [Alphaproteobacteria bacterium]